MSGGPEPSRRAALRVGVGVIVWALVALPTALAFFLTTRAPLVIASHDATVRPTLDHYARIEMGPYLPDLRMRVSGRIGADVELGKTSATSTGELVRRYALLGSRPQAEVRAVAHEIRDLMVSAALRGAVIGLVPMALWALLGPRRRAELVRPTLLRAGVVVGVTGALVLVALQPWEPDPDRVQASTWTPLPRVVPEVVVPPELEHIEVQGGLLTADTRRLISSAFDSYRRSKAFFERINDKAPSIAPLLRVPENGDTVAVLVSDRHDNITMDQVVRTVADLAEASVVIDAGDDTSTGQPWEAFSLESLDDAFASYDTRIAIAGNHDHGSFVSNYLEKAGWTHLDESPVTPFGGVRFLGLDDPRSSGLGSWVDAKGLSYEEVQTRMADALCKLDAKGERVSTVVVHAASLARPALDRGCVDLVLAGHLHVQVGPTRVVGSNGQVGYTYTNGTTGGAAYAIAIASKLRREAEFTFVTYRDGRPAGVQPVKISPQGEFSVSPYVPLDYSGNRAE